MQYMRNNVLGECLNSFSLISWVHNRVHTEVRYSFIIFIRMPKIQKAENGVKQIRKMGPADDLLGLVENRFYVNSVEIWEKSLELVRGCDPLRRRWNQLFKCKCCADWREFWYERNVKEEMRHFLYFTVLGEMCLLRKPSLNSRVNGLFRGFSKLSKIPTCLESSKCLTIASNFVNEDEKRDFMSIMPDVVRDLTVNQTSDIPNIDKWFSKVLNYNLDGGKKIRGLTVVYSYKMLADVLTEEDIRLANILGWCVEILQAFFLVVDDIMDESLMRRGRSTWYKLPEVGLPCAINDGLLLESGLYKLLKIHFRDKKYYLNLLELFHEVSLYTEYGQTLDLRSAKNFQSDFSNFTIGQYNSIVKYKTSYYTFYLPVALAMYMAGIDSQEQHAKTEQIMLEMGNFFQVQDDYIDVFGELERTGKTGSDIQDGKCTWLVVAALKRSSPAQRQLLEECYSSPDPQKINLVKELFLELNLPSVFAAHERETFDRIQSNIEKLGPGMPRHLFLNILQVINKRSF